ncbi:helix-turn-helix transcriptional regulator [Janthinobacterium sp. HLX7-2]|uniref:helix-turn-helix transcriptional regulator n=1 Tax=Janthinobacterium sp. HLX7-2 TaxID=1259331 RepID=UPI003F21C352
MARTKKNVDKEQLRQRRAVLYDAIARGEVTLQNAVKEMRAISRLTQAEFAAHRGISLKTLKEIESGKGNPTIQTLNRIGQFFGLEVAFVRTETLREQTTLLANADATSPVSTALS